MSSKCPKDRLNLTIRVSLKGLFSSFSFFACSLYHTPPRCKKQGNGPFRIIGVLHLTENEPTDLSGRPPWIISWARIKAGSVFQTDGYFLVTVALPSLPGFMVICFFLRLSIFYGVSIRKRKTYRFKFQELKLHSLGKGPSSLILDQK